MPHARRLAVALVALVGLVLTVLGAWFAVTLGPSGTVTFTASASQPLVIGPSVLNRVKTPVTVVATSAAGPVFLAAAAPRDASDAVGAAKHEEVVVAQYPARTLSLTTTGDGALADPTGLHVWRQTAQNTLVVSQDQAPQAVLAYAAAPGPVDVTLTWSRSAWFVESVVVLILGLIILAFAGGWLRQQLTAAPASGSHRTPSGQPATEGPAADGQATS